MRCRSRNLARPWAVQATGMCNTQRTATRPAGRILAAVVVLTLAPSCSPSRSPEPASPTPAATSAGSRRVPPVVVTGAAGAELPFACRPAHVGKVIASLVAAFNAGDADAFDRLASPEPEFQWYSVGGRPGERIRGPAYDRAGLVDYVLERHAHGERLRVLAVRVNGSERRGGLLLGHFEDTLTRWAKDFPGDKPVPYIGKGALNCTAGRVLVWSMAPEPAAEAGQYRPCPEPPASLPPGGVVACAQDAS